MIGSVTSAAWGHRTGQNIAMGFIDAAYAEIDTPLEVKVIGEATPAVVCEECLYDPEYRLVMG